MSNQLAMANARMKFLMGVAILSLATMASAVTAQTTLYGGGATLPKIAYVGIGTDPSNRRLTTPSETDAGSLFGSLGSSVQVQYCNSDNGERVLIHTPASNPCDGSSASGFSAPAGQITPDFAASDMPLNADEYNLYASDNGSIHGEAVQFPALVGSVAIVFNKATVSSLSLTADQVCRVFSGEITNWDQISSASGQITIVYRSDGSGTSFSFSNFLAAACSNPINIGGGHFDTNGQYGPPNIVGHVDTGTSVAGTSLAFLNNFAPDMAGDPPSVPGTVSLMGASGNQAVVSAIAGNDGTIGYAETANVVQDPNHPGFAMVEGKSPVLDLPKSVTVSPVFNRVINSVNQSNGRPQLSPLTPAIARTSCMAIVDPNDYATGIAGSYPILAMTHLLGNFIGNGATNTPLIRTLLSSPYTTAVDPGDGYALLDINLVASVHSCINE